MKVFLIPAYVMNEAGVFGVVNLVDALRRVVLAAAAG